MKKVISICVLSVFVFSTQAYVGKVIEDAAVSESVLEKKEGYRVSGGKRPACWPRCSEW